MNPVTDATTTSGFLKTANGQILGNNGTNNVGLFGFDDTGTMVVKVAKPGYDANSATDDQLIFNSAQNVFKIVQKGTAIVPTTGGKLTSLKIYHNLGYVPMVLGYVFGSAKFMQIPAHSFNADGTIAKSVSVGANSSYIEFDVATTYVAPVDTHVTYYLLQETTDL